MKTRIILFSLVIFCQLVTICNISAQPNIEWSKNYGGSGIDVVFDMEITNDGGFILAGTSNSFDGDIGGTNGGFDVLVLKLNSNGELDWKKNYGGSDYDVARAVHLSSDGGFFIACQAQSNDGDVEGANGYADSWVLKLNSVGELEWKKNYGGSSDDIASCLYPTTNGGLIIAHRTSSSDGDITENNGEGDIWVIKLNANGELEWEKSFGGSSTELPYSIIQSNDNGYLVVGGTYSNDGDISSPLGDMDCWVLKLDEFGVLEWERNYGGTKYEYASSVQQTFDDGYIICGGTESSDGDVSLNYGEYDAWVIKLDSDGELEWEKNIGTDSTEFAMSLDLTPDGDYIVAGYQILNENADFWAFKLNSSGELEWEKNYGGNDNDYPYKTKLTPDNGIALVGISSSTDGDIQSNNGDDDIWIIKLDGFTTDIQDLEIEDTFVHLFPNPAATYLEISTSNELINIIELLSSDQKILKSKRINNYSETLDVSNYSSGVYFVKIYFENKIIIKKIVLK